MGGPPAVAPGDALMQALLWVVLAVLARKLKQVLFLKTLAIGLNCCCSVGTGELDNAITTSSDEP